MGLSGITGLSGLSGLVQSAGLTYAEKIIALAPGNLLAYWPLWEAAGGVATDISGNGLDGTYTAVTLGQPGIGDGNTCPLFDGALSIVDIFTAGLGATFDGNEGSAIIWAKVFNVGIWTDGLRHHAFYHQNNFNNHTDIRKSHLGANIWWTYSANGVSKLVISPILSTIAWMTLGITWSFAADEARAYYNGVQSGVTQNALGDWSVALTGAKVGADSGSLRKWHGWLAHHALWDVALTPAQMAETAVIP